MSCAIKAASQTKLLTYSMSTTHFECNSKSPGKSSDAIALRRKQASSPRSQSREGVLKIETITAIKQIAVNLHGRIDRE